MCRETGAPWRPRPNQAARIFSKEFVDLAAQSLRLGTQHAGGGFSFSAAAPAASAPALTPSTTASTADIQPKPLHLDRSFAMQ